MPLRPYFTLIASLKAHLQIQSRWGLEFVNLGVEYKSVLTMPQITDPYQV